MSDENKEDEPKVQADNNSIAIGNISAGGNIGSITIGNTTGFSAEEVSVLITQISTTFQPKPFDGRCPYKGLDSFNEEDSELFFGREKWIENLMSRVKESRTLFITGQSGSGKSSLVRAGLIPALKTDYGSGWLYATMKSGRDPVDALANAFSRLKDPSLGKYLRENANSAGTLHECAESALSENANQRLILFIDQFEEVFTQLSKDKAQTFINLLDHATTVENGRVIILFSMRSDFVPNCAAYPQLNALLNRQFVQIGAMQPEELVSAIAQPALRVGLKIDPDLIAQIINDMKSEPGVLPLMQFALKDLFDAKQAKGGMIALSLSDYLQRGGIDEALERHADASLEQLSDEEKEIARNIFSGLVEIGDGTQDTRRTALPNELIPASAQADMVKSVVQKLTNARLITTDAATVTISHEKLIDAWPWLKKLVNENRDVIELQNEIAADAKAWAEHGHDHSYLYSGGRLANAIEALEAKKLVLNELAQSFINTANDLENAKALAEERRRQKELDDARQLAEIAQARANAERRGRLVGRWMLVVAGILIVTLGYISKEPIRNEIWRQQLMKSSMVKIPAGDYMLGDEQAKEYPYSFLRHQEYPISAYAIDIIPVTNRSYGLCIQAGICSRPEAMQSEYTNVQNANKYVVNITADNAAQYCDWLGMRLPSEKEWELAMRKELLIPLNPDALTNPISFFEWTTSQYDQNDPEWIYVSLDPPEVLIQRGGQLNSDTYITIRQNQGSTISDNSGGFRCAIDQ